MTADTLDLTKLQGYDADGMSGDAPLRVTEGTTPAAALRSAEQRAASMKARLIPMAALCFVMCTVTLLSKLRFADSLIASHTALLSGAMLLLQLVCCGLSPELFLSTVRHVRALKFDNALPVLFANLFTAFHAALITVSPDADMGLPFCAVAGCAVLFWQLGSLYRVHSRRTYLRLLSMTDEPKGVYRRHGDWDGGDVIIKCPSDPSSFIGDDSGEDASSKLYGYVCPAMLIIVTVSSLIILLAGGRFEGFIRSMSSLGCACCAFSATLCIGIPMRKLNRSLSRRGSSMASWDSVRLLHPASCVVISDNDLFPPGRVELTGMKIIGSSSIDWVLSATASTVEYAGSALAKPFIDLMHEQGGSRKRVNKLISEPGGYVSSIQGYTVYVGTLAFMRENGIFVHDSVRVDNGIFMAVNSSLSAVYVVRHTPSEGTVSAFDRLLKLPGCTPILASRDFSLTPARMKALFSPRASKAAFPDLGESGRLLMLDGSENPPIGVVCREGLSPYVSLISGGRRLYLRCIVSCLISVLQAIIGMEFMFFLSLSGNLAVASAANLLIYSLLWLVPIWAIGSNAAKV
ncbi:MAG: hypothetical protein IKE62_00190 [Oscillospiraceae bacterium]|nr:hypothetical protein [Oscillospiraceae bacterium]